MNKFFITMVSLLAVVSPTVAQKAKCDTIKEEPKGKAIIQVFTNAHTGFGVVSNNFSKFVHYRICVK